MPMHSVRNHSQRAYFDEVMLTCFRGLVFFETQCKIPFNSGLFDCHLKTHRNNALEHE